MQSTDRILLLVSERIGDIIFCTPAIQLLRTQLPNAQIAILAPSTAAAAVLAHNPAINAIFVTPDKKQLLQLRQKYNVIIDLHNNKLTSHYRKLLKLPIFISPRSKAGQHQSSVATEFIASLLKCPPPTATRYSLYPQPQHFHNIEKLLNVANVNLNEDILIGCHMGCSQVARRGWKWWKKTDGHKSWPISNFIMLENQLRQIDPHIRFILTGSKSETHLCQQLLKNSDRAIDLSGKTSVLDMTALMHYCKVFLTGDTGPLHIACSTTIPVVTLFGPTAPSETGPYPPQSHHHLIQQPHMKDIEVEDVAKILETIIV